jgi:hypothetical protein
MRMGARKPLTADDLDAAITHAVGNLRPVADNDWSATAGPTEWTCQRTADHIGHCMLAYAMQLNSQPQTQYIDFFTRALNEATGTDRLQFTEAAGRLLATTIRFATPGARGFHPFGNADPEGFAGLGCVEVLLHGQDMAAGLGGAPLDPPRDVCQRVLARMFPDIEPDRDPWLTLQWATGRISLPGRPKVTEWSLHSAPLVTG